MTEETIETENDIETEETSTETETEEVVEDLDQDEESETDESSTDSSEESEGDKPEDTEIEIGVAGEDDKGKKKGRNSFSKRINELGRKRAEESQRADLAEEKAAELQELLKLKEFADKHSQDGKTETKVPVRPKPEDFDLFEEDEKYKTALENYDDARVDARIAKQFADNRTQTKESESIAADMRKVAARKDEHYESVNAFVDKYGVKDYEDREAAVRQITGDKVADQIIKRCNNAHLLFTKWGKNPEELHDLVTMFKSDPDAALMELGALNKTAIIKNKPRAKTAVDDDLEGSSITGGSSALQRKLDNAYDKDDFALARKIEAKAEKQGIVLKRE